MPSVPSGNNIPSGGDIPLSTTGGIPTGGNVPASTTTLTPPGTLLLWYDAQNIDGSNNSTLVDGQALGTWKNLGTLGAAGDAIQATAGNKPVFRLVAVAGKIGNKSAVEAVDAARFMRASGFTSISQPVVYGVVFRTNNKASVQIDITTPSTVWQWYIAASSTIHVRAGTDTDTTLNPSVSTFHTSCWTLNGASSAVTLDGTSTGAINPGANASGTQIDWMSQTGGAGLIGYFVERVVASGTTAAAMEAYFASKYGAFPQ